MENSDAESPRRRPVVRALSFHAEYKCRNTGVCCSSGWEIAVEEEVELRLTSALARDSGLLPNGPDGFQPMHGPPDGCRSSLRRTEVACWFRDETGRCCAIHRNHGEDALPSACRQFPRICVLESDAVSVSLSHYCPTAADLLFSGSAEFRLATNPRAFPSDRPFEGLDARGVCPPFLRPGVLLGFDGLRAFEERAVAVLSRATLWPALATIEAAVERARTWTVDAGPLRELVAESFVLESGDTKGAPRATDPRSILLAALTEGTRPSLGLPSFRPDPPALSSLADLALRRYLASRLIAAWITFQGNDLRSVARYLRLCLDTVLLFESARAAEEADASRWKEAIRSADLWLLHYCDPDLLAKNLR
jgi:Fe-S-cluster containining protein